MASSAVRQRPPGPERTGADRDGHKRTETKSETRSSSLSLVVTAIDDAGASVDVPLLFDFHAKFLGNAT